ncbi:hypothetical protein BgiMline_022240, partial [Biomphalaria glabrata]
EKFLPGPLYMCGTRDRESSDYLGKMTSKETSDLRSSTNFTAILLRTDTKCHV